LHRNVKRTLLQQLLAFSFLGARAQPASYSMPQREMTKNELSN
jgi:hypothetical protein